MNTTCERIALGAVLVAILACLLWYMAENPAPGVAPVPSGENATTTSKTVADHADYYLIDAIYPASTPLLVTAGAEADAHAAKVMETWVLAAEAEFKNQNRLGNLTEEDIKLQELGPDKKYAQDIEYAAYASPRTLSYVFSIYEDTLGAHPNSYYRTFTFDSTTGKALQLGDLFMRSAPYLDALSRASRAFLYAALGEYALPDFVDTGTSPDDAGNFQFFALDGTDLLIFFPPYAVGPYAIGPQTVRLPRSDFADILKPEYQ
ncbi:MAG: RsiV family protein [bacterium]